MTPEQLARVTTLHDKLLEVALTDADPAHWIGVGKKPSELTRDERGDAQWCRKLAIATVALTMQVQRLMQNPIVGGASVPDDPPPEETAETTDDEISRYERAAGQVLDRMRKGDAKR
jgi:hypothetical protein